MKLKEYQPELYWNKRGKNYINESIPNNELQVSAIIKYLKTIEFESVLEIGCGYGRITKEIINNFPIKEYVVVELSKDQLLNATKYVVNNKIEFINCRFEDYSTVKSFDLVFACEVLLHVKPENIFDFIAKALFHTNKHFVHVDPLYDIEFVKTMKPHNFLHDYEKIYINLNQKNLSITPVLNQGIYDLKIC